MLSVKDFMSRVMAWPGETSPGWVNLEYAFKPDKAGRKFWSGKPFRDIDQFLSTAAWATMQQNIGDVYYCMSVQRDTATKKNGGVKTKRGIPGALWLKAIWLDVDVKDPPKGYATFEEALKAIAKFCKDATIPFPTATVRSGGGVHIYWISNTPLTPAEWRPYAQGLRNLAEQHGLRCDYGVTTDAARLLRVPGTFNYKTEPPKPVELLGLQPDDFEFQTQLELIKAVGEATGFTATTVSPSLSAFPQKAKNPNLKDSLADGIVHDDIPLNPLPIVKGCPLWKEAITTHGKDHQQPIWNLLILGSTFMEGGERIAHAISDKHPGYDKDATDAMFQRKLRERQEKGLGWPSCASFQNEGCKLCAHCAHNGKIKSPLKLGMPVAKIAPVFAPAAKQSAAAQDLCLPEGYILDNSGWINHHMEVVDPNGGPPVPVDTQMFYCKFDMPYATRDDATEYIHFTTSTSLGNERQVKVRQGIIPNSHALSENMCDQGVKLNVDALPLIRRFMMAWLTKLHQARAATASAPFGWHRVDGKVRGFIYGGHIMYDDGTTEPANHTDPAISATYKPRGSTQAWLDAFDLIKGRPALEAIVAASFAAPLLGLAGQTGGIMYAWGPGGENKTTAMDIAVSVWGSGHTKETLSATPKSLIKKMGALKNLPLFWDEIQDEDSQKKVFDLVFSNTEGVSYSKLNSAGVYQAKTDWQTLMIAASNYSFVEYVAQRQKQTTAGMDRVLEYEVPPAPTTKYKTHQGDLLRAELRMNQFGGVGLLYSKFLAENHAKIAVRVQKVLDDLDEELHSTKRERFWKSSIGCILAGAEYANQMFGSKVFDVPAMKQFLVGVYIKCRERIVEEQVDGGTVQNTEGVLNHFLGNETGRTLCTAGMAGPGRPDTLMVYHGPKLDYFREAITVQRVIGADTKDNAIRMSNRAFREFLKSNRYNSTPVVRVLKNMYGLKSARGNLAAGTPYQGAREEIMHLPVPEGSPFELYLYGAGVPHDVRPERIQALIREQQIEVAKAVGFGPLVSEAAIADQAAVKAMIEGEQDAAGQD